MVMKGNMQAVGGSVSRLESDIALLKRRVQENQERIARLRGQYEQLIKQLQEDFQLSGIDDAKVYLQKLKAEADALRERVRAGVEDIKAELGW